MSSSWEGQTSFVPDDVESQRVVVNGQKLDRGNIHQASGPTTSPQMTFVQERGTSRVPLGYSTPFLPPDVAEPR
jgi:hypothetical protein